MRILVVEDEPRMSSIIQRGLEEEGYAVDAVADAAEARLFSGRYPYDLLILDIVLPGEDGFSLCRSLRRSGVENPVLMLTCKADIADRVQGLDCGADDYMLKPFAFEELSARIRALLRRQPDIRQDVLRAGPLVMNTTGKEVSYDGRALDLTAKEFAVLELLMRHPGAVVHRLTFEEHIWDQRMDSASNLIDVYIQRLRRKIGGEGSRLIQTVHGMGYRLKVP